MNFVHYFRTRYISLYWYWFIISICYAENAERLFITFLRLANAVQKLAVFVAGCYIATKDANVVFTDYFAVFAKLYGLLKWAC